MRTRLFVALVAGLALAAGAIAFADPWKHESGNGHARHGDWRAWKDYRAEPPGWSHGKGHLKHGHPHGYSWHREDDDDDDDHRHRHHHRHGSDHDRWQHGYRGPWAPHGRAVPAYPYNGAPGWGSGYGWQESYRWQSPAPSQGGQYYYAPAYPREYDFRGSIRVEPR